MNYLINEIWMNPANIFLLSVSALSYIANMKIAIFRACAIFIASTLAHAAFADGKDYHDQALKNHDFKEASLNGANFSGATVDSSNFNNASAKNANFKGASLESAQFQGTDLTGADFTQSTGSAYFYKTKLDKANLEGAAIQPLNCSLKGANLKGAKIEGVLSGCDFSGADLRGANLRGIPANVIGASNFKGAIYDDDSSFPDGFDPAQAGMVLNNKKDDAPKATDDTKPADTTAGTTTGGASKPFFSGAGKSAITMASVAGKYVGEDNKETYFILGADGSFTIHEGGQDMTGTYKIDGDTLNLNLGSSESAGAKVVGKELVPTGDNGQKMMKQD